ncbi:MAG TPA: methyltransferase domain-containing protein [Solirubrobacteraceae bacterium]|nr:methyltransferase domain-containing protein [Solirubrobacteraceae bacterium]
MNQLAFDEHTGRQLEALYHIDDARARRAAARTTLAASRGERILDVGCGPGFFCEELLAEVGEHGWVTGLDASPHMLALAKRRCAEHENVAFQEADATALPVEAASFDAALCVQVLEYVSDYSQALAELHRAVRPGGRVVVWDTDWATVSWHSADAGRMQRFLAAWDEHLVHPSLPRTLAPAMRLAGFERVRASVHTFAATTWDPGTFGVSLIGLMVDFAPGRNGLSDTDAQEWAAEQRALGERGEFFFAYTQFCFTGTRAD